MLHWKSGKVSGTKVINELGHLKVQNRGQCQGIAPVSPPPTGVWNFWVPV